MSESGQAGVPVEQLRDDIAQTRQELGATVEALAAKADVKSRARDAARESAAKAQVRARHAATIARLRSRQAATVARERGRATAGQVAESVRRRPTVWVYGGVAVLATAGAGVGVASWRRRRVRRQRRAGAWRVMVDSLAR